MTEGINPEILKEICIVRMPFGKYKDRILADVPVSYLEWYMSPELRRRVTAGLNKGEARNALARAVYFNRFGEVRERSFENQRYKASGLNLVTAAIVLWNTVYIEKAVQHLKEQGEEINEELLQHLSPLGWEHIHLTGDYVWEDRIKFKKGEFRSLRNSL